MCVVVQDRFIILIEFKVLEIGTYQISSVFLLDSQLVNRSCFLYQVFSPANKENEVTEHIKKAYIFLKIDFITIQI